jgi:hypothetical protein
MSGPSIHYRRRWFYGLWVTLLVASAGFWALWEIPLRPFQATLALSVHLRDAPGGTQVQVWNGPRARWEGLGWSGAGAAPIELQADGRATLPVLRVHVAPRRWLKGQYIPRDSWDLVMLRFTAPAGQAKYVGLSLADDIQDGVLRPKWKLAMGLDVSWNSLRSDGQAPDRLP